MSPAGQPRRNARSGNVPSGSPRSGDAWSGNARSGAVARRFSSSGKAQPSSLSAGRHTRIAGSPAPPETAATGNPGPHTSGHKGFPGTGPWSRNSGSGRSTIVSPSAENQRQITGTAGRKKVDSGYDFVKQPSTTSPDVDPFMACRRAGARFLITPGKMFCQHDPGLSVQQAGNYRGGGAEDTTEGVLEGFRAPTRRRPGSAVRAPRHVPGGPPRGCAARPSSPSRSR